MSALPIEAILGPLKDTFNKSNNAVLVAAPGAGKTTRIPLALLHEPWLAGRRIVMLEPRRLAARSAARYMAALLGEQVGDTVGYRVRMDTKVGLNTLIEVVTEGVLTRMLQSDPALEGVGLVIFDEFHERSLHADLGLALCLQSQAILRGDLKILIMSATLDSAPAAELLGHAPIIECEGKAYPVDTRYLSRRPEGRIEQTVVRTVLNALAEEEGDILVFLPGSGEIRRVEAILAEHVQGHKIRIAPLYSQMPQVTQDIAVSPCPPGERKIVLATSIAESSLTVEGIRIVVDSGLMRVPRFSPRTGMTRLETIRVSRSSADQRRGRAGRLEAGICYRLWTEADHRDLTPYSAPEITEADLAPLVLELAVWGETDPDNLLWLDPPPGAAYRQAQQLLHQLGAVSENGILTPHGRRMAQLGPNPRLSHMILKAIPLGIGGLACELAALLGERDILRGNAMTRDADLRLRIDALHDCMKSGSKILDASRYQLDTKVCKRITVEADRWKKALEISRDSQDVRHSNKAHAIGILLAFAYPDRIAQNKGNGRFLLSSGRGAAFTHPQPLSNDAFIVAAELDDAGAESKIYLAAPVDISELQSYFADFISEEQKVAWDRAAQAIRARKQVRLGALLLQDSPLNNPDPEQMLAAMIAGIAEEGMDILPWTRSSVQLRQRLLFMHRIEADNWPDVSDENLLATIEDWLAPYLHGMKSRSDLQKLHLTEAFEGMLSWAQRKELDQYAPTHIVVPSGSRIPIDYSDPAAPILSVRLQEMFGLQETPRIARGKTPLTLHLLSPAQRPVQVTQDLANFWNDTYFEVKKDLKGRYPKHYWPDDPLIATPTHRVRPRQ